MVKEERSQFELIVTPPKKVVSVKLDVDTIELLDRIVSEYGYSSRSELIREAIYFYIAYLGWARRKGVSKVDEKLLDELEKILEGLTC